jgi:phage host-nuclease inhibitor protein Gam
MRKFAAILVVYLASTLAVAADQLNFGFKNPTFSGNGWSSQELTIQQQEFNREQQIKADKKAAADAAIAASQNTNLAKFLNNLESRIYAQISQQMANNMFTGTGGSTGTMNFDGNTIFWVKNSDSVTLQVTDTTGNVTTVTVPIGSFVF